jgi:hypothetical protein
VGREGEVQTVQTLQHKTRTKGVEVTSARSGTAASGSATCAELTSAATTALCVEGTRRRRNDWVAGEGDQSFIRSIVLVFVRASNRSFVLFDLLTQVPAERPEQPER